MSACPQVKFRRRMWHILVLRHGGQTNGQVKHLRKRAMLEVAFPLAMRFVIGKFLCKGEVEHVEVKCETISHRGCL